MGRANSNGTPCPFERSLEHLNETKKHLPRFSIINRTMFVRLIFLQAKRFAAWLFYEKTVN